MSIVWVLHLFILHIYIIQLHPPYRATMTLENVLLEPTLDTVKGILILDNDGKRILAKWVVIL